MRTKEARKRRAINGEYRVPEAGVRCARLPIF